MIYSSIENFEINVNEHLIYKNYNELQQIFQKIENYSKEKEVLILTDNDTLFFEDIVNIKSENTNIFNINLLEYRIV